MGKGKRNLDVEEEGLNASAFGKVLSSVRGCLGKFSSSKPPEPAAEVVELLQDMKITPRLVIHFHQIFKQLKQSDPITLRVGPNEVSTASMTRLVKNHRKWVAKILILLLDLAGYKDTVTWDGFIYVTMQFCSMSKLELCQVMFYIVSKEMKSWTVHYLTSSQLEEFYDDYYACPVQAFNTNSIDFAKLPLAKYRMQDYIELCYRFSQLINPCMHLQRSLQQSLASLRFWSNVDRGVKVYNRKISLDFFRVLKVTSILELMQRQAGAIVGPIQSHRLATREAFATSVGTSKTGYKDDIENFKVSVLKAMDTVRPVKCGILPLPTLGVHRPVKEKLKREIKLPRWMHRQLEQNQVPGVYGGQSLGHAAMLEFAKREKIPPTIQGPEMPKSVEESERLIRSTFGEVSALKATSIRQIAANLFHHAAKPPSENTRQKAVIRSQELEFIRMSRRDDDPPSLVSTMYRLFQEELIHRSPKDGELPIFMVSSGAAYKPPGMGGSGGSGGTDAVPATQKEVSVDSTSEGEQTWDASAESTSDVELSPASTKDEKGPSKDEKEAFDQYLNKFGENRAGENPGYNRQAFPWAGQPNKKTTPKEAIEAVLLANQPKKDGGYRQPLSEVDSEGEEVPLCTRCCMPVGQFAYEGRQGRRSWVHAECMAQVLVEDAQRHEDRRASWEAEKKLKSRKEYEIGWRMDSVPQNALLAERMGCSTACPGLCCLVLDEASRTVKVAPTLEPAAAVNLEYLLLALKVRKTAKREPLFSLDPVDPQNLEKTPQKKVYEPSWLAGTSVGDVMFQADYFLKELALGEYTMPVAGMMSVFDWSEVSSTERDRNWSGREWFVVRKAEVRMSVDQTLVPVVKMGVEAREQILTKTGLEDAAVTANTHPLKKFADAFTRNFDLVAERKSVVFHLRELAKASVMAKYLVDSNIRVSSSWYQLADEIVKNTAAEAHPQIPQLWNMRGNSRIQLKNGRLIDMITGGHRNLHAIYGGVEFGLDRFELAQRHAMQGQAGMQLGQSGRPMFMPQRFQIGQQAQVPQMPQGVDLNLDKFNLSRIEKFAGYLPAAAGTNDSLEAKVTLGKAFLKGLRERKYPGLKAEYEDLLLKVYESPECDRSEEGDAFVPPDPSMEYTSKIRSLVNEEKLLFERRQMHFFDKAFQVGNAGAEFPRSWTSRIQLEKDGTKTDVSNKKMGLIKVDFDDTFAMVLTHDILPTAAPEFKKQTEDGSTFRIYQIGSLEVRTTQLKFGQEKVGAIFSSRAPEWQLKCNASNAAQEEKLQECKVFIEPADGHLQSGKQPHHFYLVFKTVQENVIVVEQLSNGSRALAVNPQNLEDRNSLAKQLFTADCSAAATIGALSAIQAQGGNMPVSLSVRKQFAKMVFKQMTGQSFRGRWGGSVRRVGQSLKPAMSVGAPELGMLGAKKQYNLLG